MPKNFRDCPRCKAPTLIEEYTIVKRETCSNCSYFTQSRLFPLVQGGQGILECLVDYFLENDRNGPALEAALQRQIAKAQRRNAKHCERGNGGAPHGEEDWQ